MLSAEMCPTKRYEVLTPSTCELTLFGNRVFAEVIELRSLGWTLIQHDRCPYKRKMACGNRDAWGADRGRDWSEAALFKGHKGHHQKLGGGKKGCSPEP